MTVPTMPNTTIQSSESPYFERPPWELLSHGMSRTDAGAPFHCQPVTTLHSEIFWKPVILPLLERLSELRSTRVDKRWPMVIWPEEAAFSDAGKFTERLPMALTAQPHISLADDGEVNFAWSYKGTRIDLGFYGTNTFSYYAREENGKEWFGDDKPVASPLPVELEKLLTA